MKENNMLATMYENGNKNIQLNQEMIELNEKIQSLEKEIDDMQKKKNKWAELNILATIFTVVKILVITVIAYILLSLSILVFSLLAKLPIIRYIIRIQSSSYDKLIYSLTYIAILIVVLTPIIAVLVYIGRTIYVVSINNKIKEKSSSIDETQKHYDCLVNRSQGQHNNNITITETKNSFISNIMYGDTDTDRIAEFILKFQNELFL